jgi:hypothetical protein
MRDTRGAAKSERQFHRRWEDRREQAEKRKQPVLERVEVDAHECDQQPAR